VLSGIWKGARKEIWEKVSTSIFILGFASDLFLLLAICTRLTVKVKVNSATHIVESIPFLR
jgi:hypothetical protein